MVVEALKYEVPMVSKNARKGAFGLIGLSIVNKGPICLSGGPNMTCIDQVKAAV